jgi:hypothetical protein
LRRSWPRFNEKKKSKEIKPMHQITVRKLIEAPSDRVWEFISKFEKYTSPEAEVEDRECRSTGAVPGRAEDWISGGGEPAGFLERLLPLRRAWVDVSVRHAGANISEVTVRMDYAAGRGPIGALVHRVAMRPGMRRSLGRFIESIACRTGSAKNAGRRREREGILREARAVFAAC